MTWLISASGNSRCTASVNADTGKRGRLSGLAARASGLASQVISWLSTAMVPVTQTKQNSAQSGNDAQPCTRNHRRRLRIAMRHSRSGASRGTGSQRSGHLRCANLIDIDSHYKSLARRLRKRLLYCRHLFQHRFAMKYAILPVTAFEQNCSFILCEDSGKLAIVDPGGDIARIEQAIAELGGTPEKILVTHAHIDHAGAVAELAERLGVPVEGPHREDQFWIDMLPHQSQMFGFPPSRAFTPDRWLED